MADGLINESNERQQSTGGKGQRFRLFLLAVAPTQKTSAPRVTSSPAEFSSPAENSGPAIVREPETSYALEKYRSIAEGVGAEMLPEDTRSVLTAINEIDQDGFLYAGDPYGIDGSLPVSHEIGGRPMCVIWIPGLGKRLLESLQHWLHVGSSAIGQRPDEKVGWFDAIRTIGVQSVGESVLFLTAKNTTADPFVCRLGNLFRIPTIRFEPLGNRVSRKWLREKLDETKDAKVLRLAKPVAGYFAWMSNQQHLDPSQRIGRTDADSLLAAMATNSVLLSVSAGGRTFKTTQRRLHVRGPGSVRLLVDHDLTKPKTADKLSESGSIGWWLRVTPGSDVGTTLPVSDSGTLAKVIDFEKVKTLPLLIHWTRRRTGSWPDQTRDEYLDDLIFCKRRRNHSERDALCRILASRRILSSGQLTRDPRSVACFSNMTLEDLASRRLFRQHLNRWDFEPYGIAFFKSAFLRKFGAKPVVYGEEADWQSMDEAEQPFFQVSSTRSKKIDWRDEQEWRVVGDVELDRVGVEEAIVFVKYEEDLEVVRRLSAWPVVVLEQNSKGVN